MTKNSVIKDGVGSRVANNIYHALSKYFNVFSLECISLQEEPSRPLRPPLARAWDAGEMRRWSKSANSHRHGREVLSPQHTHSPTLTNSDMKTSYQPSERSCWLGAGPSCEWLSMLKVEDDGSDQQLDIAGFPRLFLPPSDNSQTRSEIWADASR